MNDATPQVDPTAKVAPKRVSGRQRAAKAPQKATAKRTNTKVQRYGPTETAVRAEVETLHKAGHDPSESLAQMAYHLARKLDDDAGLATAAVARELRATLAALTPEKADDDGDAIADLIAALSAPVDNAAN